MEQKLRFGLFCAQMSILKKNWADYEQLLVSVYSCFQGQKEIKNFFKDTAVESVIKGCIK